MEAWQIVLISIVMTVIIFTLMYKRIPAKPLKTRKPVVCLLPKFKTTITLTDQIINADNLIAVLSKELSKLGFNLSGQNEFWITYSRGHILADFSVDVAKVNIKVTQPISNPISIIVEYGWVAAFDTGDLWTFTTELKRKLSN